MSTKNDAADYKVDDKGVTNMATKKLARPGDHGKTRKIVIHPRGPEDSLFQPVGVNGKVWLIRKGVEAEVPEFVLGVLQNCVETHWTERREADGEMVYVDRDNPRFTVEVR